MSHPSLRLSALLAALLLAVAACDNGQVAGGAEPAASVNDEDIPEEDLEDRFDALADNPQFAGQLEQDDGGAMEAQLKAELLTQMIQVELLRQGADEMGVEVGEEELAEQRAEIEEELEAQGMNLEQVMEQQGLDQDDLDEELEAAALQEEVVAALTGDDEVTDDEVATFYEDNPEQFQSAEVRHILVESEDEAEAVLERLEEGEDFAELAEEESIDEQTAEEGGELGEVSAQELQMMPALSEAVFEQAEPGDVVGPIEGEQGFHVVEVLDRDDPELEEVEDDIREDLAAGEQFEVLEDWLAEQRQDAEIEVAEAYGQWDAEQGQVVPDIDEGDMMMPGQPEGGEMPEGEEMDPEELEEELEELEEQMEEDGG